MIILPECMLSHSRLRHPTVRQVTSYKWPGYLLDAGGPYITFLCLCVLKSGCFSMCIMWNIISTNRMSNFSS